MKFNGTIKKVVSIGVFFFIGLTQQVHADPIGTILGGIAGSQFGQGNGKIAMTIIGAVTGDLASSQASNVQVMPSYQTAYYAPPIYNAAQVYYTPQRPGNYYNPPVAPQVYYQPAPAYQYPYQSHRFEDERRHYGHHHPSENYREYREHHDYRGWR